MRYADGGGLTAAGRAKREVVRFEAAEMFGQGLRPPEVARRLRLSRKSAYAWHAAWRDGGKSALSSKGPGGLPCRLSDDQAKRLQAELDAGPATHGWSEDQRWTLARVADLIHRLFGYRYTPRGVSYLLHRLGWSPQVPAHRAVERDEQAVARWPDGAVVTGKRTAQLLGAWIVFEDEAGQDLKPGRGRTWSRRGRTPLVRVTGKGSGRVLMAGMICVRPGRETRLIYRTQTYRGRTGEKKGFRAREFADLLTSAHRQLGDAPLIVVWDNASTHHAKALREFCDRNSDWLTIIKLPPYAPDLNPVEGVWAHLKKSLANLAPRTIDDLTPLVKNRLRAIQRRPQILNGFIAETGLRLEPP
ncbi:IS630 family transposase [Streptomyces flavotricini]|uniref:IS630 family transposase n=1 Tax=Streptomyces flavotricini TaxID=66888 RepID=UPI003FD6CE34